MFTIQSRPDTYETCTTSDGRQVVIGRFHIPFVVAVFFDAHGTFLCVERKRATSSTKPDRWNDRTWRQATDKVISSWKLQIGFLGKPISIEPFFLEEYSIGIRIFPLDLADYLANPLNYPTEDQALFSRDVERWKNDGNFVFYWSESYHLDKNGDSL